MLNKLLILLLLLLLTGCTSQALGLEETLIISPTITEKITATEAIHVEADDLTAKEVDDVKKMVNFTADEDLVYTTILKDKKEVEFDLSKISKKEVDNILMGIMIKLGATEEELFEKIKKGEKINFDKIIKEKSIIKLK